MQVKETGDIYCSYKFIDWCIPHIPCNVGLRLWSPRCEYHYDIHYPHNVQLWRPGCESQCEVDYENKVDYENYSIPGLNTNYLIKLDILGRDKNRRRPVFIRVGVIDENGRELLINQCTWDSFERKYSAYIKMNYDIQCRFKRQVPNGWLRLFCELSTNNFVNIVHPSITDSKVVLSTFKDISVPSIQTKVDTGEDQLKQDFENLLTSRKDSDLTVKVQHREFHVHKCILRARSPVFDSMLSSDFTEKTERLINIEDIEPEVFEDFLLFVYSGKTEHINSDNVYGLYYASDKYNTPYLRTQCVTYLKKAFSVQNICKVVCLAIKHSEAELLQLATKYFSENMEEILVTCDWLKFLKDNPIESNELILKSLKLGYTKKDNNDITCKK